MAKNYTQEMLFRKSSTDPSHYVSMSAEPLENHILIIQDEQGRKEFTLDRQMYSIGRDRLCDIRLFSQFVSRRHAMLVRLQKESDKHRYYYRIMDGDAKGKASANGLMINGRRTSVHDLKNGDEIVFGPNVSAIYYLLQREATEPVQTDATEYDITLINPGMTDDDDD